MLSASATSWLRPCHGDADMSENEYSRPSGPTPDGMTIELMTEEPWSKRIDEGWCKNRRRFRETLCPCSQIPIPFPDDLNSLKRPPSKPVAFHCRLRELVVGEVAWVPILVVCWSAR